MPRIRYVGPYDAVEVPALGVVCERDATIDVADAELAASLLDQADNWTPAEEQP